jgi:hypothetical protein
VVSDHGQSQGPTFSQVGGRDLLTTVQDLMDADAGAAAVSAGGGEDFTPVNALLSEVLGSRRSEGQVVLGPDGDAGPGDVPEVVTVASGNLGAVWFARLPGRVTLEEVTDRWPRLVPGLVSHPAVGVVVARTALGGPVAVGPDGAVQLESGVVEGTDPLEPYGPRARADLLHAAQLDHAGDLVLISSVDVTTEEVHAFEELVGSHGGLGGDQNRAVLVHPAAWSVADDFLDRSVAGEELLVGAETVHRQLVRWLEQLGLRHAERPTAERPTAELTG